MYAKTNKHEGAGTRKFQRGLNLLLSKEDCTMCWFYGALRLFPNPLVTLQTCMLSLHIMCPVPKTLSTSFNFKTCMKSHTNVKLQESVPAKNVLEKEKVVVYKEIDETELAENNDLNQSIKIYMVCFVGQSNRSSWTARGARRGGVDKLLPLTQLVSPLSVEWQKLKLEDYSIWHH